MASFVHYLGLVEDLLLGNGQLIRIAERGLQPSRRSHLLTILIQLVISSIVLLAVQFAEDFSAELLVTHIVAHLVSLDQLLQLPIDRDALLLKFAAECATTALTTGVITDQL